MVAHKQPLEGAAEQDEGDVQHGVGQHEYKHRPRREPPQSVQPPQQQCAGGKPNQKAEKRALIQAAAQGGFIYRTISAIGGGEEGTGKMLPGTHGDYIIGEKTQEHLPNEVEPNHPKQRPAQAPPEGCQKAKRAAVRKI